MHPDTGRAWKTAAFDSDSGSQGVKRSDIDVGPSKPPAPPPAKHQRQGGKGGYCRPSMSQDARAATTAYRDEESNRKPREHYTDKYEADFPQHSRREGHWGAHGSHF